MIPGLGDGLRTLKGAALPLAFMYRRLASRFRVYAFSRRDILPQGYSTRDMARDVNLMMERLGIVSACILGVSQGGMIAQYLAIDNPRRVDKLILAVTLSRPNDTMDDAVEGWVNMAKRGDYRGIMRDLAEKSYSPARVAQMKRMYMIMASVSKPASFDRFIVMANACAAHDCHDELYKIKCPTLIIAGEEDNIVTAQASRDMARVIDASELFIYEGLGHAAYEEAPDFLERAAAFCET
ncbi:MAG: alpha/beta hydrolase [Clostridia bacterium]|nr:alpha/beta hydrolase [Clostridia bacterium]